MSPIVTDIGRDIQGVAFEADLVEVVVVGGIEGGNKAKQSKAKK